MWKQIPLIGKISLGFRQMSYLYAAIIIVYHHYDNNLELGLFEWATIIILQLVPAYLVTEYTSKRKTIAVHIRHVIIDLFFAGWTIGVINLTILPSFITVLSTINNYIAARGFKKLYWLLLFPVATLICLFISGWELIFAYSSTIGFISMGYAIFHFAVLSYMSYFYSIKYYKNGKILKAQKLEIDEQHEEIQQQAEELKTLNNSLSQLNNDLEKAVVERTKELKEKNIKLAQHAYLNAHKLRAPLARVLGLLQLHQFTEQSDEEREKIIQLINENAKELDSIASAISSNLEDDKIN